MEELSWAGDSGIGNVLRGHCALKVSGGRMKRCGGHGTLDEGDRKKGAWTEREDERGLDREKL